MGCAKLRNILPVANTGRALDVWQNILPKGLKCNTNSESKSQADKVRSEFKNLQS